MSRFSAALLLCFVAAGHAMRMKPSASKAEQNGDCCCKPGPCKGSQENWDETMKYNFLHNKCCKFRNKDCLSTWWDWHPYTDKANKDMCETPKASCSRSWKGVHFDTVHNATSCDGDSCVAFEISEQHDMPILTVHMGAFWAVKQDNESSDIDWKPVPANPNSTQGMFVLNLREIDVAKRMPNGRLVMEKGGYQVMSINAGLYHDEHFVADGLRVIDLVQKMNGTNSTNSSNASNASSLVEAVAKSQLEAESNSQLEAASESQSKGFLIGCFVVGGYYSAATASGVAVSNTALASGMLVAGGATAAIGAILAGPAAGPVLLVALFLRAHEVEEDAAMKVWSMLKCHSDFKECGDDTIVPATKKCPEE